MTQLEIDGIPVDVQGTGAQTIVMIHGWPDTMQLWDRQVAALAPCYRCVRFTLPGFEPGAARSAWSIDALCAFFDKVIQTVSAEQPVTLLLHDWGCAFGYRYYLRHPQRVWRIIGVDVGDPVALSKDAGPKLLVTILTYQHWLALAWLVGGRVGTWMARAMAKLAHCPTDQARICANQTYPYYMTWLAGAQSYRHRSAHQSSHRFDPACPMLFIYGARKPFMFHSENWIARLLKNPASRVVALDTGHWVMIDQPAQFNATVIDWLQTTSSGQLS